MKIHEYQAKQILKRFGVDVPEGEVVYKPAEARTAAGKLSGKVVVKSQIHAGGRGKGGGVKIANNVDEAEKLAAAMLGNILKTHQTGPEGKLVRKVLIEETVDIDRELYVGLVLDRAKSQLVFMASTEGGVEIEKVAGETPEKIMKEYIDPGVGLQDFQARNLAFGLGLKGEQIKNGIKFMMCLYRAFIEMDCTMAEINPLVVTRDGRVLALDAKINLDDNALFRHKELLELRDIHEEDPLEVEASKFNLNYIKLDGEVGCMVNGAGLAMATMDIIKLAGSEPANFLDVGGSASAETVENGFNILLADKNVKAVLINIFGGIVRCDRVATGVIDAASKVNIDLPVVIRLQGTNSKEAAQILKNSDLKFTVAINIKEAAAKVVAAVKS